MVAAIWKIIDASVDGGGPPVILEAPEGKSLRAMLAEVGRWAGRPRNLAADGFTDPQTGAGQQPEQTRQGVRAQGAPRPTRLSSL